MIDLNRLQNFNQIKKIFDNLSIDVSDQKINELFDSLFKYTGTHDVHELQHWIYIDLNSDFVKKTDTIEDIDWEDLNNSMSGIKGDFISGMYWIKIFRPDIPGFYSEEIENFFIDLNELKLINGIHFYDLAAIKDVKILDHNDPPEVGIADLRLLYSIDVPEEFDEQKLGFKYEGQIVSPAKEKFILFDQNRIHSAWNYTGKWWKFFVIDINQNVLSSYI